MAKSLALARQQYDMRLGTSIIYSANLFCRILPEYEKNCLSEYVDGNETLMMYGNSGNAKMQEHGNIAKVVTKKNPYWLVYDLIKLEERDGQVRRLRFSGIPRSNSVTRKSLIKEAINRN
jgi:hypothetical protein